MAIGDQADITSRLFRWVPSRWFPSDPGTLVGAVLAGFAAGLAGVYQQIQYAKAQMRIATASDGFLDLIGADYFGTRLPRATAETDAAFRLRIAREVLRPRGTRAAVIRALTDLTGRAPAIFEPNRPLDTGAWGIGTTLGYGLAGGYGSLALPDQAFVTAFRPLGITGLPAVAPYGVVRNVGAGAYGLGGSTPGGQADGTAEYTALSQLTGFVSDAQILAAIEAVRAAGTIIWARVSS
jgi:hypothetical protein